jgi:hypothetical protein
VQIKREILLRWLADQTGIEAAAHTSKALPAIGTRIVIDPIPHYINERQSDLRGVKEGWYAIDEHGILLSGPFSNQESCLTRISQSVKWSGALETRRPLSGIQSQ